MREARDKTRERLGDLTLRAAYVKEQKAMQWAVVQAKRALMSKIINGFNETRDVFRAIKWANDKTDRRIPLLQRPDGSEWRFQEPNPDAIEWPPLSSDEVKAAIWKPANTAPGADRIPNEVWKRAWKPLGNLITGLYNLCLDSGHHPSTFKKADLVAIPKPGRPRQAPRSYRLISLLPTLGKGLERAVARRLAEESIERETIPRNYICAVPKRAVTDMLIELRGRIEDAQDWKKVTSIFTFDIKGAFDAVDPARMEHRLIENRWPTKLCRGRRYLSAVQRTKAGNILLHAVDSEAVKLMTSNLQRVVKELSCFGACEFTRATSPGSRTHKSSKLCFVIHGVPIEDGFDSLKELPKDMADFNGVKISDSLRWLVVPAKGKQAGSVVVEALTQADYDKCVGKNVNVGGAIVPAVPYVDRKSTTDGPPRL
ncbi:uncharacterized protein BROUX77_007596 [Berkeleyomyces rouxiae]|uniref:uncharacterized protein n=1 Tax=Berkeleyomyces rouxiae TaxID=2035830 RepID=UPI003B824EEA